MSLAWRVQVRWCHLHDSKYKINRTSLQNGTATPYATISLSRDLKGHRWKPHKATEMLLSPLQPQIKMTDAPVKWLTEQWSKRKSLKWLRLVTRDISFHSVALNYLLISFHCYRSVSWTHSSFTTLCTLTVASVQNTFEGGLLQIILASNT